MNISNQLTTNTYGLDKTVYERQELALIILIVLNNASCPSDAIACILQEVKNFGDYDAVGIRLIKDGDFPYYVSDGFSDEFIHLENSLCSYKEDGTRILDKNNQPLLECMCGNILKDRTNPSYPFFTEFGSFYSNCTTKLIASTTEEERQNKTRNICNKMGYESVALIPIKSHDKIIGLLQINDYNEDKFTLDLINFYEQLSSSIGIAFDRFDTSNELNKTNVQLDKTLTKLHNLNNTLEKKINRRTKELSAANELKNRFLSMASHEFKTPLTTILSSVELLDDYEDRMEKERKQKHYEKISKSVKHLSKIVDEMLLLGKVNANVIDNAPKNINAESLCNDIIENFLYSDFKRHKILLDCHVELVNICADERALYQIISNVVSNALKYSPIGSCITITVAKSENMLEFEIKDDGMGISKTELNNIYEPFYRGSNVGCVEGTGLGLSVVKQIVRLFGGKIIIKSKLEVGTVVKIQIPISEKDDECE